MKRAARLFPYIGWLSLLSMKTLRIDANAGLTNAIIALPQCMAFALVAGMPPQYGLYAAMIIPPIAALFGSSWQMISGPAMAISLVVFASVSPLAEPGSQEYIELALVLTLLTGAFQLAFAVARMGGAVNFVSHTVVVGFTAAAAILILTGQLPGVLGISLPRGLAFYEQWGYIVKDLGLINPHVISVSVCAMLFTLIFRWYLPKWPGMLIALVAGAAMNYMIDGASHGVKTIGALPMAPPTPEIPTVTLQHIRELAPGALALAILGLIEAVAIARSISLKTRQPINANKEFFGQGLSNLIGSFFSAFAGSGSFTRSAVNVESGARTPLSSVFAAICLGLLLLLVAPLTKYIPLPAMAGVVLIISFNLIHPAEIIKIWRAGIDEWSVLLMTMLATLFVALEFAVYGGVLLSLIVYLNRTAKPGVKPLVPSLKMSQRQLVPVEYEPRDECPQLKIASLEGSLFFGAAAHVSGEFERMRVESPTQAELMLMFDSVNFIDLSGAEILTQEAETRAERGGGMYLIGVSPEVSKQLDRFGVTDVIPANRIYQSKNNALAEATRSLDLAICSRCQIRLFQECDKLAQRGRQLSSESANQSATLIRE